MSTLPQSTDAPEVRTVVCPDCNHTVSRRGAGRVGRTLHRMRNRMTTTCSVVTDDYHPSDIGELCGCPSALHGGWSRSGS
jgi:hypothetical protein